MAVPIPNPTPLPPVSVPYPNWLGIDWPTSVIIALTLAAALFAVVGILLAIGGVIAYFDFRTLSKRRAEATAMETATSIATLAADAATERYLQLNLRTIVQEYINIAPPQPDATRVSGDQIAAAESSDDPPGQ